MSDDSQETRPQEEISEERSPVQVSLVTPVQMKAQGASQGCAIK